jgi:flagellar export protein FliJ
MSRLRTLRTLGRAREFILDQAIAASSQVAKRLFDETKTLEYLRDVSSQYGPQGLKNSGEAISAEQFSLRHQFRDRLRLAIEEQTKLCHGIAQEVATHQYLVSRHRQSLKRIQKLVELHERQANEEQTRRTARDTDEQASIRNFSSQDSPT